VPKHNISDFNQLYRRTLPGVGVTGSVYRFRLGPIGAKTLRVLTHVTVENQTSGYTKCRLGISAGGKDHYLEELQNIAAEELAVSHSDVLLGEGDYFFADLTGVTTGDSLVFTAIGWTQNL